MDPHIQQLTRKNSAGSATEHGNSERTTKKQPAKKSEVHSTSGKAESERTIIEREIGRRLKKKERLLKTLKEPGS